MGKTISRSEVGKIHFDYAEIMNCESHHDHEIIEDEHGTLRWKENAFIKEKIDPMGMNNLTLILDALGHGKNSEVYRKLYRDIGYSIRGYHEIFYWELNHEDANLYIGGKN